MLFDMTVGDAANAYTMMPSTVLTGEYYKSESTRCYLVDEVALRGREGSSESHP